MPLFVGMYYYLFENFKALGREGMGWFIQIEYQMWLEEIKSLIRGIK